MGRFLSTTLTTLLTATAASAQGNGYDAVVVDRGEQYYAIASVGLSPTGAVARVETSPSSNSDIAATVDHNGRVTPLPMLPGFQESSAASTNSLGFVPGFSKTSLGDLEATVWAPDGTPFNLNTILQAPAGVVLTTARQINELGQVLGRTSAGGHYLVDRFFLDPDAIVNVLPDPGGGVFGAAGVSDNGIVAGVVVDAAGRRAATWSMEDGFIDLHDASLGPDSEIQGINGAGTLACGNFTVSGVGLVPASWDLVAGTMQIHPVPFGLPRGSFEDVNDSGELVGTAWKPVAGSSRVFHFDLSTGVYTNVSRVTPLKDPATKFLFVFDFGDDGRIVVRDNDKQIERFYILTPR